MNPTGKKNEKEYKDGDIVSWTTIGGFFHKGKVVDRDSNVIIVDCEICGTDCCFES